MKQSILVLASILSLSVINGCCEKEYVFIEKECPVLQTWEVEPAKTKPFTIDYEVIK